MLSSCTTSSAGNHEHSSSTEKYFIKVLNTISDIYHLCTSFGDLVGNVVDVIDEDEEEEDVSFEAVDEAVVAGSVVVSDDNVVDSTVVWADNICIRDSININTSLLNTVMMFNVNYEYPVYF